MGDMPRNRTLIAAACALLTAAGLTAAATGGSAVAQPDAHSVATAAHTPPANSVRLRIGTYNIRADTSTATFKKAATAMLGNVDVIGMQEINSKAKAVALYKIQPKTWSYYRQVRNAIKTRKIGGAEQTPIMWRTARFNYLSACRALSSPATSVHGEIRNWKDQGHWVQVVRLQDRWTGQKLAFIDVHLIDGVVIEGHAVKGKPYAVKLYKLQLRNLVTTARKEQARGYNVFVLGDFNSGWASDNRARRAWMPIRQFAQLKMVSMWATSRPAGSRGTHAHSLIDQVFNTQRAYATKVYFGIKYSDHFPAMGTYYLTKGTGDAEPIPGPNTTRQPASLPPTTGKGLKDPHWTEGRCGDVG